ncbi:MAG: phosphoenolpyruvate carboxykinase [Promethearchaeota archaeon]
MTKKYRKEAYIFTNINCSEYMAVLRKAQKLQIKEKVKTIQLEAIQETQKDSPESKERIIRAMEHLCKRIDLNRVRKTVEELFHQPNVAHPSPTQIKVKAEMYGRKTIHNNYNFISSVKNRSAGLTVYIGSPDVIQYELTPQQKQLLARAPKTIESVLKYLQKAPLLCNVGIMGKNPDYAPTCTLYVSLARPDSIRLAHMMNQSLFETTEVQPPNFYIVDLPEWHEKVRQIICLPEIEVTFVLGSDYYGEIKKGFLRMAMWYAKQKGMLGLHAGAKLIKAKDHKTGTINRYSMLIFGLTATGKTTHSCHTHDLNELGEGIEIVQDDFVALKPNGAVLGTERGFFLKTEGITPQEQPLIYNALIKPHTILENVLVDYLDNVDFLDKIITGNGRAIILREDLGEYISSAINSPPLSNVDGMIILMITRRNTVVPIVSKLNLEQAAAAFMLGESIETSGSNPERAGDSIREVGTNPFIIGNMAEEGNRFYDILKKYPDKIHCYLANTGGVGEIVETDANGRKIIKQKVLRVEISEMAAIIRGIARDSIEWEDEPYFGVQVPKYVPDIDIRKFDLAQFYTKEQIHTLVQDLKRERKEYLVRFPKLYEEIKTAFP